MSRTQSKSLVLILARELASLIATPVFLVGPDGKLVFYNEAAEEVLGLRFDEAGELGPNEWATQWKPEDLEGNPIPMEELPLVIALRGHRPAHRPLRVTGLDGVKHTIAVTAFPLFAKAKEFVGAAALFWEKEEE